MHSLKLIVLSAFFGFLASAYYEETKAVHASEHNAVLNACREDNVILQRRYDMLAHEAGWLQVVEAERKYQEGGQLSIEGWYYLHTNGDLIYKRELGGTAADIRESDFARSMWPFDPTDREGAWRILVEASSLGAKPERIRELASLWQCDDADAQHFADLLNITLQMERKRMVRDALVVSGPSRIASGLWRYLPASPRRPL